MAASFSVENILRPSACISDQNMSQSSNINHQNDMTRNYQVTSTDYCSNRGQSQSLIIQDRSERNLLKSVEHQRKHGEESIYSTGNYNSDNKGSSYSIKEEEYYQNGMFIKLIHYAKRYCCL